MKDLDEAIRKAEEAKMLVDGCILDFHGELDREDWRTLLRIQCSLIRQLLDLDRQKRKEEIGK